MIKKSKQINKGSVKNQKDKAEIKKKAKTIKMVEDLPVKPTVSKVWECIVCGHKVISEENPTICVCSNNGNYVINNNYTVGE